MTPFYGSMVNVKSFPLHLLRDPCNWRRVKPRGLPDPRERAAGEANIYPI